MEPNKPTGSELPQFELPKAAHSSSEYTAPASERGIYDQTLPEQLPIHSSEKGESMRHEQESTPPASQPTAEPPTTLPSIPQGVSTAANDDDGQSVVADDLPLLANDDDLIEKDWVDKAKKIIQETKDDPRRREEEISKLQADYIKKRYGREIGVSVS